MEEFKKKIQRRFNLCLLCCCSVSTVYFVLSHVIKNAPDFSRGMISGLFVAIDLICLYLMIRYMIMMRNEKKLKEEYIRSTDERNIAISRLTMTTSSVISLICTVLAIIITGFFSQTVSITLFIDMAAGVFITVLVNIYYNKKI